MKRRWAGVMLRGLAGLMMLGASEAQGPTQPAGVTEAKRAAIEDGATVQIDYTLTVDGAVVDSSEGRSPLQYVQGQGKLLPALERQLAGLHPGDTGEFTFAPKDGYGPVDPKAFVNVSRSQLPPDLNPEVNTMIRGTGQDGRPFRARIHEVEDDSVTLDFNHPLAGKTLHFKITVVDVSLAH